MVDAVLLSSRTLGYFPLPRARAIKRGDVGDRVPAGRHQRARIAARLASHLATHPSRYNFRPASSPACACAARRTLARSAPARPVFSTTDHASAMVVTGRARDSMAPRDGGSGRVGYEGTRASLYTRSSACIHRTNSSRGSLRSPRTLGGGTGEGRACDGGRRGTESERGRNVKADRGPRPDRTTSGGGHGCRGVARAPRAGKNAGKLASRTREHMVGGGRTPVCYTRRGPQIPSRGATSPHPFHPPGALVLSPPSQRSPRLT